PREAGEGDRRGDHALPGSRGARARVRRPGRADGRHLRELARTRRAARDPRLVTRRPRAVTTSPRPAFYGLKVVRTGGVRANVAGGAAQRGGRRVQEGGHPGIAVTHERPGIAVVSLAGEHDQYTAPKLSATLADLLA